MEDGQRRGGCNAMAVALWQWRVETELRVRERAGTRMPARERDKGEQQKRRNGTGTGTGTAAREERERNLLVLLPAVPLSSPRSCSLVAILGSLPRRRGYRLQGEEKEHRARYTNFFFRVKIIPSIQLYEPRLGLCEGVVLFFFYSYPQTICKYK